MNPSIIKNEIISLKNGDIAKLLSTDSVGFNEIKEVYISKINPGIIKGWTRHNLQTNNLIVIKGQVRVVCLADANNKGTIYQFYLNSTSQRLILPPNYWFSMQNLSQSTSEILNISDSLHSDEESDKLAINRIPFKW